MNAQSSSPEAVSPAVSVEAAASISTEEIDRSCCLPVGLFFISAAKWLVIALVLGLISSTKLHASGFLAGFSWLTYGRIHPASLNALAYGFASQIAFGVALWLLARLGRVHLAHPATIFVGGLFWNVGVLVGIIGILAGHNTGYEWLEMPRYAAPILFIAYVLIGIGALTTFHLRRERTLYVSQWYILAALLWFPWIYSTAQLLLVFGSMRGTLQAVVNGWYVHNFYALFLAPVGIATVFYFIPKTLNRPLYSRYLALFGFWLLALLGGWGGLHALEPVPKWIPAMSVVATVLSIIPLLAVATNWHLTLWQDCARAHKDPVLRFTLVGGAAYLLAGVFEVLGALPSVGKITSFTIYDAGLTHLQMYGFLGMVTAGSIYYIAPRMTRCEWPSPPLIQVHFWLGVAGIVLTTLPLLLGGFVEGLQIQNASTPFIKAVRSTIPFLGLSTLGTLLLIGANLALYVHLAKLLLACGCWCSCPVDDEPVTLRNSPRHGGAR